MVSQHTGAGVATSVNNDRGSLLRLVMKLDALATGAVGLLLLAAGWALDGVLGTPLSLLVPVGLVLTVYALAIWMAGSHSHISKQAVSAAIVINLLWTVSSIVVVVAGWFSLTGLGIAFVLAQAAAVALFADLQFLGMRRAFPSGQAVSGQRTAS